MSAAALVRYGFCLVQVPVDGGAGDPELADDLLDDAVAGVIHLPGEGDLTGTSLGFWASAITISPKARMSRRRVSRLG